MWRRSTLSALMMTGPLVFLIAIAINGRMTPPPEPIRQFGPEVHERLVSYIEPIRAAESLNSMSPDRRMKILDKVVAAWTPDSNHHPLTTIFSPDFDTVGQDNVLTDIKLAKQTVVMSLHDQASRYAGMEEWEKEARSEIAIIEVAAVNKYCDFTSVHQFGHVQLKALERLDELAPKVSKTLKQEIGERLEKVREENGDIQSIALHLRKLHADQLVRRNNFQLVAQISHDYHTLALAAEDTNRVALQNLKSASMESKDAEFIRIGTMGRLAILADKSFKSAIEQTKQIFLVR